MSRQGGSLVAFLWITLAYSTSVYCVTKDEFSHKLLEMANNILGVEEFQVNVYA